MHVKCVRERILKWALNMTYLPHSIILVLIGLSRLCVILLAGISSAGLASANIDFDPNGEIPGKFSIEKNICLGNPNQIPDAANCDLAPIVPSNTDVYYVFTLTNPWGEPAQYVDLQDNLPSGFNPSGALSCQSTDGTNLSVSSGAGNSVGIVPLAIGETVQCILAGQFTSSGAKSNTVHASNGSDYSLSSTVNTTVAGSTPSGMDLSVSKSSSPSSVNVSSGPQTITYTVKIKNNSSAIDADLGDYFKLHDKLALLSNSVPFRAEFVSASCTSTPGTDCLDNVPTVNHGNPDILVGTAAPSNFLTFEFPTGSNGHIEPGGEITLTITVRVRWLPGLSCVRSQNGNGIRNIAFFTLFNDQGSALSEDNSGNNTGKADTSIQTGVTNVDPDCALGQIKLIKRQEDPDVSSEVSWGDTVTYAIVIKNVSLPAQTISFNAGDISDWVTEGINTPPFTREHVSTVCASGAPAACAAFNAGLQADPDFNYSYYTQSDRGWAYNNPASIALAHGESLSIETKFIYKNPDCETVPAASIKPIINTARLRYKATQFGAFSATDPQMTFSQSASETTLMKDQDPCKFKVIKETTNNHPNDQVLFFGTPVKYRVTFESQEPGRHIGTLLDRVRISHPDYADGLNFISTWNCTDNGRVNDYEASGGPINGTIRHTSSPAQGTNLMNLRWPGSDGVFFEPGGVLTCDVELTIKRPKPGSDKCMFDLRMLQNLAMMDVTHPFNSSIHWPPSGTYDPAATSRPAPQDQNWAMVDHGLPRCMDMQINKDADVDGLPSSSAPWTYAGGPEIDYTVSYTNTTKSGIMGSGSSSSWNGLVVKDIFDSPYGNISANGDACSPASTCRLLSAGPGREIGIDDMATGLTGHWTFSTSGPFQNGKDVKNCVIMDERRDADPSNGYVYQNYHRPVSLTSPATSNQRDCVEVPVINLSEIRISKQINDQTGANVTTGGPFEFKASCDPYDLFLGGDTVSVNAGETGIISRVPVRSNCTLQETGLPDVPQAAIDRCAAQGLVAEWGEVTFTPATVTSAALKNGPVNVTASNEIKCSEGNLTKLDIKKILTLPSDFGKLSNPLSFDINVNCSPEPSSPSSITLSVPTGSSGSVNAPVGTTCTLDETLPISLPQQFIDYCQKHPVLDANGNPLPSIPQWNDPQYGPAQSFQVFPGVGSWVTNSFRCVADPNTPTEFTNLSIRKRLVYPQDYTGPQFNLSYDIIMNCNPGGNNPYTTTLPGAPSSAVVTNVPIGAVCEIEEILPPTFPQEAKNYCKSRGQVINKGPLSFSMPGFPAWRKPAINPGESFTVDRMRGVMIQNEWYCTSKLKKEKLPKIDPRDIKKIPLPGLK